MRRRATLVFIPFLLLGACNKNSDDKKSDAPAADGSPTIQIKVDAVGYHPSEAKAKAGKPVRLEFTRTSDEGCGQQLVFPTLDIKKDLPLNEPVTVDLTMPVSGKVAFTCGMDMYRGSLIAE
jgi:plastocyanin domain-containing protein